MSAVQLQNDGVVELFAERFAFHNIDSSRIVIEITESTLQSSKAREVLTKIKALGAIFPSMTLAQAFLVYQS
ncbi:sensory box/GGDEF family protein [marine sediment metagenome]|uniref:Sensory box/GGDEF family protein n=1 Tax=marine sediment metagenome TaxID=412755 RepID=A0A1B6NT04_9ZZZZ